MQLKKGGPVLVRNIETGGLFIALYHEPYFKISRTHSIVTQDPFGTNVVRFVGPGFVLRFVYPHAQWMKDWLLSYPKPPSAEILFKLPQTKARNKNER